VEATTVSNGDFLREMRVGFRNWKPVDVPLPHAYEELLQPDSTLIRRYASGQEWCELAVIAGHRKQTIHLPAFCVAGDGWEVIEQGSTRLPAGGRTIAANQILMSKERHFMLVSYFFTDGTYSTPSLIRFQAKHILERFRTGIPLGALVRIMTPVGADPGAAVSLTNDFAAATLPSTLELLRGVHLYR
jgi:EpsI family protein